MKLPIDQSLIVAIFVALLLVGLAYLSLRSIDNLVETSHWVEHTQIVIENLDKLHLSDEKASTGTRGFILNGNPSFLQDFQDEQDQIPEEFQYLKKLTVDNPHRESELSALQDIMMRHLDVMQRLATSANTLPLATLEVDLNQSNDLLRQIDEHIALIQSDERVLLQQRTEAARQSVETAKTFLTVGSTAGIFVLLASNFFLQWEKKARTHAQQELDRFFTLSRDMLCVAGFDGYFKRVNPAWEIALGYTQDEMLSRPFLSFVHPDDVEKTISESKSLAKGQETVNFENRYRCKDGSYRWLLWSSRSLVGEKLMFASARDMTERKVIEEQILKLNEELKTRAGELETTNKELEAFSYSVSHDLRAPLRHIHGFVEILQKSPAILNDPQNARQMNIIARAARDMGLLIDDLLAFSRTGRAEMHRVEIDMLRLVEAAIREQGVDIKTRKVTWDVKPLPKGFGDSNLIRLVWVNLISNALKYTRPREETRIEIGSTPGNGQDAGKDETFFYIRDNGVGFDMRYYSKLFGVFQRLHRAEDFEGTGIGLANVQRIIQRHGGRVWAESEVNSGSTFYFFIPTNPHRKNNHV